MLYMNDHHLDFVLKTYEDKIKKDISPGKIRKSNKKSKGIK